MYKDTSIKNFPQEWVKYPHLMSLVFLMAGVEPRVAGILAQVPLPAKGPPSFTNLGVHTLWEVPLRGRCWCNPLQVRRAQRILLGNAVYRIMRWLASLTSKFSVYNPGLAITKIFKIPARIVLLHSGYSSDKGCFWAVRGWQIIPTLLSHLGQAAAVPGRVSQQLLWSWYLVSLHVTLRQHFWVIVLLLFSFPNSILAPAQFLYPPVILSYGFIFLFSPHWMKPFTGYTVIQVNFWP